MEVRSFGASPFRKILVDTSLLIEQQKSSNRAKSVRLALATYGFKGASTYSKLEIKRAWLQRFGYIHSLCRQPGVASVANVFEKINRRLSHWGHRRAVQTCLDLMVRFLREDAAPLSKRAALGRLKAHCKNSVLSFSAALQEIVTGELDGTGCVRAAEPPREMADGSLDVTIHRCTPKNIQCTVHIFFDEHRSDFRAIANYVDEHSESSDELKCMRDHIRKAERDSVHLCDDKCCCKLADMIIAVDGKDMDEFAANNDSEWVPIAKIMKKPLVNPIRNL